MGVADGEVVDGGGASGGSDGEDGDGLAVSGRDGVGGAGGVRGVVVAVGGSTMSIFWKRRDRARSFSK